ncbi:ribosomal protein L9 [Carex rostrata]
MATISSLALRTPCTWLGQFIGSGDGLGGMNPNPNPIKLRSRPLRIEANKRVKKIRQVILKEDIGGVGKIGEQVKVKAGFFRNYLLPYGKADLVSPRLLKEMEREKGRIEAEQRRVKEAAEQVALLLQTVGPLKVRRKSTPQKQIVGSVTSGDVADIIKAQLNRDIGQNNIIVPEITELGDYIAEIKLHEDVSARVRLLVLPN